MLVFVQLRMIALYGSAALAVCATPCRPVGADGGGSVPAGVSTTPPDSPVALFRPVVAIIRASLTWTPLPVIAHPAATTSGRRRPLTA